MFVSSTNAKTILDEVMAEMGLYTALPRTVFRRVLNEALGRLYGEVVLGRRTVNATSASGEISLSSIPLPQECASLREEDVLAVRHGTEMLTYLPPARFALVSNNDGKFFTVENGKIRLSPSFSGYSLTLTLRERPRPFSQNDEGRPLPMPDEYVGLIRAKLMGEIFKLANEDALSAKWLSEYNAILPAFALYCAKARRGVAE